jgi:hypothetical protein
MNSFTQDFSRDSRTQARKTQHFCSTGLGPLNGAQKVFRAQVQAIAQLTFCALRRATRRPRAIFKNPRAPDAFRTSEPQQGAQNSAWRLCPQRSPPRSQSRRRTVAYHSTFCKNPTRTRGSTLIPLLTLRVSPARAVVYRICGTVSDGPRTTDSHPNTSHPQTGFSSHPPRRNPPNHVALAAHEPAASQQLASRRARRTPSNNVAPKKRKNFARKKPNMARASCPWLGVPDGLVVRPTELGRYLIPRMLRGHSLSS